MDDKDSKLIALLRTNARAPVVALARRIGLSRSATQDRLVRLEESGAILGYTVVEGAGTSTNQAAHLLVRLESGKTCERIVPRISPMPFVTRVDSVTGEIDLVVTVDADTLEGIDDVRNQIASIPGIASIVTLMVMRRRV